MLLYFYCHCERAVCASVAIAFMVLCHCERFSICHCEEGFLFVIARRVFYLSLRGGRSPTKQSPFLFCPFTGVVSKEVRRPPSKYGNRLYGFFLFAFSGFHGKYRGGI